MRIKGKSKQRGGRKAGNAQYQVTRFPTAIEFDSFGWEAPGVNASNIFLDDGNLTTVQASATSNLRLMGFDFEDYLPSDAEIDMVEVELENRHEGIAANPRPGVQFREYGVAGVVHEQLAGQVGTSLAVFTWDLTDISAEGFPITSWTRDALTEDNMRLTARVRNVGSEVGTITWDYVAIRVTYTGSPPGVVPTTLYTLTASLSGNGSGKVTSPPGIDTSVGNNAEDYPIGTQVPVLASPDSGSTFIQWTGDVTEVQENQNPITISMDGDKLVDAEIIEPPPSDVIGTHAGPVIAEDMAEDENYVRIWRGTSNAFANGADHPNWASDPYIELRSGDGDWRIPEGQVSPNDNYRRLILPPPPTQSLYDITVHDYSDPAHRDAANTRNHLYRWTGQDSLAAPMPIFREGDRMFWFISFRLQDPPELPYDQATGGGNSKYTQLCQWKCRTNSNSDVILSITVGRNGIKQVHNTAAVVNGSGPTWYDIIPCTTGVWHRICQEVRWSVDPDIGYYRLWGQFDDAEDWTEIGTQKYDQMLMDDGAGDTWANCGIGPYSKMSLMDDEYHCDYANVQFCNYI